MVSTTTLSRLPMSVDMFEPFLRRSIGFENIFRELDSFANEKLDTYPPYNIVKSGEKYRIEISVAGFSEKELNVEVEESTLTISGKKDKSDSEYLHRGIAGRRFVRKFTLSADLVVKGANIVDGILVVDMQLVIPDEKKPRTINIGKGTTFENEPELLNE